MLFVVILRKTFFRFQNKLYLQLHDFETTNINYVVCGDININTLSNNPKESEYIAALNSIGCNQMIDVPTRFAYNCKSSLLNHVYTNITKETYCGVCLYEVSDHLPTFFVVAKFKCCLINKRRSIRCMKNFNLEDFLVDMKRNLSKFDFDSPDSNINNDVCNLTTTFKTVLNKHVALRTMTRKEKKLSEKPWITKGILVSLKMKNKLFRACFKSNNADKKAVYKKYLNELTHIK